ncbi:hypothetical protein [Nitratidesulfovibrio sp.]|uniref:hypothetical protein n=1 Tax=Nitratidesulfovibrio sp. TaxID=2802297 RepID=UPI003342C21C
MTATTRARFLRGLFSLGADLAGSAAGLRPSPPCPPDAGNAGETPSTATAEAEPAALFSGGVPLCGPGGDFTPELLRLEAERMGLPADAGTEDLLNRLHRAMLDMAPPGVRDTEAPDTAAPDSGNSNTGNGDTAAPARRTPGTTR